MAAPDENFLDFFQCEAVIESCPHVDGEFMGLTHARIAVLILLIFCLGQVAKQL
jgi:hypothetical protein